MGPYKRFVVVAMCGYAPLVCRPKNWGGPLVPPFEKIFQVTACCVKTLGISPCRRPPDSFVKNGAGKKFSRDKTRRTPYYMECEPLPKTNIVPPASRMCSFSLNSVFQPVAKVFVNLPRKTAK